MFSKKRTVALGLGLMFLMVFALSGCGGRDSNKLYVGMEVGYPPMEMVGSDGSTVEGFDVDVAKEVAKRLGKEDIEIVNTAWDSIFISLDANKYDCIISAVSIKPDREKAYALTKAYVSNKLVLITKKGDTSIKTPDDLVGKKTAVQGSTTAENYLKDMIAKGKEVDYSPYQKVTQTFSDLKIGRVDAILVDVVVAGYYLVQDPNSYNMVWQSPVGEPMAIAFKKTDSATRDKVNDILDEMQADGTFAKISEKWFNADITKNIG